MRNSEHNLPSPMNGIDPHRHSPPHKAGATRAHRAVTRVANATCEQRQAGRKGASCTTMRYHEVTSPLCPCQYSCLRVRPHLRPEGSTGQNEACKRRRPWRSWVGEWQHERTKERRTTSSVRFARTRYVPHRSFETDSSALQTFTTAGVRG